MKFNKSFSKDSFFANKVRSYANIEKYDGFKPQFSLQSFLNSSMLGSLLDEKKVPCNDSSLTSSEDLNFEFPI